MNETIEQLQAEHARIAAEASAFSRESLGLKRQWDEHFKAEMNDRKVYLDGLLKQKLALAKKIAEAQRAAEAVPDAASQAAD